MSEDPADTEPKTDYSPFLRRITFLDTSPDKPGDPPVHVTQSLLLDGVEHRELVDPRFGWRVFSPGIDATLVEFVANAEYVDMGTSEGHRGGRERIKGRALCGIPVDSPPQEAYPWRVLPEDEVRAVDFAWRQKWPIAMHRDDPLFGVRGYKNHPYSKQPEPPSLVRVFLYVREVEVVAAKPV